MVQLAGMTSSVSCRKLEFGPSRHRGTSYTQATWLPRDRKLPRWLNKGREEEKGREKGEAGVRVSQSTTN